MMSMGGAVHELSNFLLICGIGVWSSNIQCSNPKELHEPFCILLHILAFGGTPPPPYARPEIHFTSC